MAKIIRKFDVSAPKLDALGRALAAEPLNWNAPKPAAQSRACAVKPDAAKRTATRNSHGTTQGRSGEAKARVE